MTSYSATYDPADDKLRLYATSRLDEETYGRVKAAGFRWAPKQELFYAVWNPRAEDVATELAGEVGDEDTSLVERAEDRADRFGGYQERRAAEAERARKAVSEIADNIPLGQPILVGHHSERRARRDAQRIEDGMRKAVRLWDTSEYWEQRAAGALRHVKYKELPAVRARRVKTLEAEQRKHQRTRAEAEKWLRLWTTPGLTAELGIKIANHCWLTLPRKEGDRPDFDGNPTAYDALTNSSPNLFAPRSLGEVAEVAARRYPRTIAHCDRWIAHLTNRLAYEKAMLNEQGAAALLEKPKRAALPPILNYRGEGGAVACLSRYHRGQVDQVRQVDMTGVEYAKIYADYKGTRLAVDGSHRIRSAVAKSELVAVFITDGKVHDRPQPGQPKAPEPPPVRIAPDRPASAPVPPGKAEFASLRQQLKAGVQVAVAPELFPTPSALAEQVADAADIRPGMRVLEPSAGTGPLVEAARARGGDVTAVEINHGLAAGLARRFPDVRTADFLECNGDLGTFDRVVMNPPFSGQADIDHVTRALHFLKPGGRLVAIMSAGVAFRDDRKARDFRATVERHGGAIEALPDDSFRVSGTGVRTVLVTLNVPGPVAAASGVGQSDLFAA